MPTPASILDGLTRVANDAFTVAVAWHVVVLLAVIALLAGWRPSRRLAGALLATPLASVSALAFAFGNPFNGWAFAVVSALLILLALRFPAGPVGRGPAWAMAAGTAMVAIGWAYPHFLRTDSARTYLIGAPMGLIPCPSLSLVIGFAMMAGGLGARAWPLVLSSAGIIYGAFGVARLGVGIDLTLVAGAAALIAARAGRAGGDRK